MQDSAEEVTATTHVRMSYLGTSLYQFMEEELWKRWLFLAQMQSIFMINMARGLGLNLPLAAYHLLLHLQTIVDRHLP